MYSKGKFNTVVRRYVINRLRYLSSQLDRKKYIRGLASFFVSISLIIISIAVPATAEEFDDLPLPHLSAEENALWISGLPLISTVETATGMILSVEKASSETGPFGVTKNNCSGGKACWYGWHSPHAIYGFNGTGASGTWPNRGNFQAGSYYARPCWVINFSTKCTNTLLPPGMLSLFDGEVTGTRVYLF